MSIRVAAVLAVLAATVAAPPLPARAAAAQSGPCPDADGVTVVVDFQGLGGSTIVRCAAGPQETGLAALKSAGISITGTLRWGEAFICRIEGRPGADTESCRDTPPANAYWSYWHASNGGSWTYSQQGVAYRTPPPGSFEGWSFALDATATGAPPPRVAPSRPAPPPPQPAPADPPAEDPPEEMLPDDGTGDGPPGPAPGGQPATPATTTSAPSTVAADAPPPAAPTTTAPVPSDVEDVAQRSPPSGAPVGTLLGLGLLLALVAAAGLTAWRRRRAAGG
jgi:hypothetical protein